MGKTLKTVIITVMLLSASVVMAMDKTKLVTMFWNGPDWPAGTVYLIDSDGAYITDSDGAYVNF